MDDSFSCTVLSIYTVLKQFMTNTHLLQSTLLEHLQHHHLSPLSSIQLLSCLPAMLPLSLAH